MGWTFTVEMSQLAKFGTYHLELFRKNGQLVREKSPVGGLA